MIWTSPQYAVGIPFDKWAFVSRIFDEDTGPYAFSGVSAASWGFFVNIFTKDWGYSYKPIDRIRFWASNYNMFAISTVDLDGWVQGVGWQHLWVLPNFVDNGWTDLPVIGGPLMMSGVRFRFFNEDHIAHEARLHEVDFDIIPGANRPKIDGNLARNILVGGSLA